MEYVRSSVKDSGAATAYSGGFASSGIHVGDVHLGSLPVARSAYIKQVERIFSGQLQGREVELAELADFCTRSEGRRWVWWQAPAWSGKSALMAWFVLHPPPQVQIASFFITARFSGHNNRVAFADVMLEQLAEIAEEPVPPYLNESTREAHLLGLLDRAANRCREHGRWLALVVDGLDEDRGVTAGPDAHSIAALLPDRLPEGTRVVVAGRPNPPVPSDVPEGHPLRDRSIVRPLKPSPAAKVIKDAAVRELKHLLQGSLAEQDLLGLVTAAGGGLSGPDLAALTGRSEWEITDHLSTASGRTFKTHTSHWAPSNAPDMYVLAHEELQTMATQGLGSTRLDGYRQRLHVWAQSYRDQLWPEGTPEYLLRGYYPMLRASGDLPRMIDCCLDGARHNRMLDVSGGDHTSLTEIYAAQQALCANDQPDLVVIWRLAITRDNLRQRNLHIPEHLPAAWSLLGNTNRAEALARSITHVDRRAQALGYLVHEVAKAGDLQHAEEIARSIIDLNQQAHALTHLVPQAIVEGNRDRAEILTSQIEALVGFTYPDHQGWPPANLVYEVARAGDLDRAKTLAYQAEGLAALIGVLDHQAWALTCLVYTLAQIGELDHAEALAHTITNSVSYHSVALAKLVAVAAQTGDLDRARILASQAEELASTITDPGLQGWALAELVYAVARIGDLHYAEALACTIDKSTSFRNLALANYVYVIAEAGDLGCAEAFIDSDGQGHIVRALANAVAKTGDFDHAEALVHTISNPYLRTQALTDLVYAAAKAGALDRAKTLAYETENLARTDTAPKEQAREAINLVRMVAEGGDIDRAETLARAIPNPDHQGQALAGLVYTVIQNYGLDRAETLTRTIASPYHQAQALADLAHVVAHTRDFDRAAALASTITDPEAQARAKMNLADVMSRTGDLDRAENLTRTITNPHYQAQAMTGLLKAIARTGDFDRAETLTDFIADPFHQAKALTELVSAVASAGSPDQATILAQRTEVLARAIADHEVRNQALAKLAEAVAQAGNSSYAETLTRPINDFYERGPVLANMVRAIAETGDIDRAEKLARTFTDSHHQGHALTQLVRMVVKTGDIDRAERLTRTITVSPHQALALREVVLMLTKTGDFDQAEKLTRSIINLSDRDDILTDLVNAIAKTGDFDRAENLIHSMNGSYQEGEALVDLVYLAAQAGDFDRAETVTRRISDPEQRGRSLTAFAKSADIGLARRLVAEAWSLADWKVPLEALIRIDPAALYAIAEELCSEVH